MVLRLEPQLRALERIVDDVAWQENHEAHTIYSAVWLTLPHVYEEPFFRLRDVCKLYLDDHREESAVLL